MPENAHVPILNTIRLDRGSSVPLYQQLYEAIRNLILTGRLSPGSRVPSSRALALDHGISRTTTRNAYDQLIAEGYLVGTVGSGSRVSAELPERKLHATSGKLQAMHRTRGSVILLSQRAQSVCRNSAPLPLERDDSFLCEACLPAFDQFPFDVWSRLQAKHLRLADPETFGFGHPAGYPPLREAISEYLQTARGVNCRPDRIILVANWLQGIELTSFVLLNPGESVFVESPGFPGIEYSLAGTGASIVRAPVDDEGLAISLVEEKHPHARLTYVNPSHQVPLGVTMTLARRLEILAWASRKKAWVIEDDFGCEFRYAGRPFPSLQGLDADERTIYCGTFNSVTFTALRIAYLVVPENLVDAFLKVLCLQGHHSASVDQAALADFISEGHFTRHLRRMRTLYENRQATLVAGAQRHLQGLIELSPANAGMHLVGWLPAGVDDKVVAEIALSLGIRLTPLSRFYPGQPEKSGVLFGYACHPERKIQSNVRRLAEALRQNWDQIRKPA